MDKYANKYITFTINDDNGIKQIKLRKKPFFLYFIYIYWTIFYICSSIYFYKSFVNSNG